MNDPLHKRQGPSPVRSPPNDPHRVAALEKPTEVQPGSKVTANKCPAFASQGDLTHLSQLEGLESSLRRVQLG
jgi:hypothetical protein